MVNEYRNLTKDIAKILDAERTLDLHIKSLEMTLCHLFGDHDCGPYHDIATEIESTRHGLHLRLLAMLHTATFAAIGSETNEDGADDNDLEGLAAREAQR